MFTKIFKWTGIVLGSLLVIVALVVGVLYARGNARLMKKYQVQAESVAIPTDQTSIERGKKWAAVLCADCHAEDFSGKPLVDDKTVGFVPAPNLTPGEGGAGSEFTDSDWILALRHGIDPHEGRSFVGMPSMNFMYLNDQDLGDLIAYIKSVSPVNHEVGETELTFMGKVILASGGFGKDVLPAEIINHKAPHPSIDGVNVNVTGNSNLKYGEYLVRVMGCRDCHSENLTGGKSPEPGAPFAPDLTSTGIAGSWSSKTFVTATRTNEGEYMPWGMLKPLDDSELESIFVYLKSLPSK